MERGVPSVERICLHGTVLEPGRLLSLGASTDSADAEEVWRYVNFCREEKDMSLRGRLLTEAIWAKWEAPRIPEPRKAKKYSLKHPWSAEARRVLEERGVAGLVIEHVYPKKLLKAEILAAKDVDEVRALLSERVLHAVIARAEHQLLTHDGSSWQEFEADPWLRYRAAWPALEGFAVPDAGR